MLALEGPGRDFFRITVSHSLGFFAAHSFGGRFFFFPDNIYLLYVVSKFFFLI